MFLSSPDRRSLLDSLHQHNIQTLLFTSQYSRSAIIRYQPRSARLICFQQHTLITIPERHRHVNAQLLLVPSAMSRHHQRWPHIYRHASFPSHPWLPPPSNCLSDVVASFTLRSMLPSHFCQPILMLQLLHFTFNSMRYIHHHLLQPIIGPHRANVCDHENGRIVLPATFPYGTISQGWLGQVRLCSCRWTEFKTSTSRAVLQSILHTIIMKLSFVHLSTSITWCYVD